MILIAKTVESTRVSITAVMCKEKEKALHFIHVPVFNLSNSDRLLQFSKLLSDSAMPIKSVRSIEDVRNRPTLYLIPIALHLIYFLDQEYTEMKCHTTTSFLAQLMVKKKVICAARCADQHPTCNTIRCFHVVFDFRETNFTSFTQRRSR